MQVLLVFLSVTFVLSLGAKLPLGGTRNFDIQQRIQNGNYAHKGQFPYIVSMTIRMVNGISGCGGSIIDHNWILTAAHCTHNAKWVKIFYGSTKYEQGEFSHVVGSENIIEHENYDNRTHVNDIALIRTPRVEYSELVNKVSLADRDNDYVGAVAVASGWGQNEDGIEQENLQFIDLQIHTKMNCWNFVVKPSDTMICVGPFVGRGDSGGPLVTRDDPKLVGVASFLDPGRLGGFSRVSRYLDWIRNHTGLQ
ncbi:serine protease 1-like [Drosophila albomicans]|uniref:Serine protease 1-like n=1 Tax=Drosophila albomicans TaxID=7291 RepID=A0A6P8XAU7_DROAB|nr:serine protease 1-like [Drosophila albomicans]